MRKRDIMFNNIREIKILLTKMGFSVTILVNTSKWFPSEFRNKFDQLFVVEKIDPHVCTFEICKLCPHRNKAADEVWISADLDKVYDEINTLTKRTRNKRRFFPWFGHK